jgi:hypothetical protein
MAEMRIADTILVTGGLRYDGKMMLRNIIGV